MNGDDKMDERLTQLGRRMMPDASFVDRVMKQAMADMPPRRRLARSWRPITLAVAASVLLSLGSTLLVRNRRTAVQNTVTVPAVSHFESDQVSNSLVRSATRWQTVTERAITLDGQVPAREIHRQEFDRVQLEDPVHHATYERVVPREGSTFVIMERY